MSQIRLSIKGKIKNTGYRYFVKQAAGRYHVNGFVSYVDNGLLIDAYGSKQHIEKFIKHCLSGPPGSIVDEWSVKLINPSDRKPGHDDPGTSEYNSGFLVLNENDIRSGGKLSDNGLH